MKQVSNFGIRLFRRGFTLLEITMVVFLVLSLLWVTALAFSVWREAEAKALCKIRVQAYNNAFSSYAMMAGFWPGDTLPSGLFSNPAFLEDTLGSAGMLETSGISCGDSKTPLVWVFSDAAGAVDSGSQTAALFPKLSEDCSGMVVFCDTSASGVLFSTDKFWLDCPRHDWLNDLKGWYSWRDPGPMTKETITALGYASATEYLAAMASSGSSASGNAGNSGVEPDPVGDDPLVGGDPEEPEEPVVVIPADAVPEESGEDQEVDSGSDPPASGESEHGNGNNGHGNNEDGVDVSNPGQGSGGPNGEVDPSGDVDDEGNNGGGNGGGKPDDPKDKDKDKST